MKGLLLIDCPVCDGVGYFECIHPAGLPCPSCSTEECERCEGYGEIFVQIETNKTEKNPNPMVDFDLDEF